MPKHVKPLRRKQSELTSEFKGDRVRPAEKLPHNPKDPRQLRLPLTINDTVAAEKERGNA